MTAMTRRGFVKGAALTPLAFSPLALGQPAPTSTSEKFDIVIAGAGHNSLITAAYLAKAGYRCLVLEGRPIVGGGVKTAELTLRGFRHDTCSSAHQFLFDNPMLRDKELNLEAYGLEYIFPDPVFHMPFADGTSITQWRDPERTITEFAKFSKKDATSYRKMMEEYESVKPILEAVTYTPIGFGKPLNDRLADHPKGKIWQRRLAMSHWEIVRANFEDDHCRSFMLCAPWGNMPPENPVTGRSAYSTFNQQRTSRPLPKGGSGKLSAKQPGALIQNFVDEVTRSKFRIAKPRLLSRLLVDELERIRQTGSPYSPQTDLSKVVQGTAEKIIREANA